MGRETQGSPIHSWREKRSKVREMKTPILHSLWFTLFSLSSALAGPIMASVVHKTGTVTATAPGAGAVTSQAGHALPEKSSLKTEPGSEIALNPFPGASVLITEKSETTLEQMEFVRDGEHVSKRAATLRLDAGRLFYSIEKFKPEVTKFQVTTPGRVVAVRANVIKPGGVDLAGMVEIVGKSLVVTVLSGSAAVSRQGSGSITTEVSGQSSSSVTVNGGSVFSDAPEGARLVNLTSGQVTLFDALGNALETRAATASELLAGRSDFQTAVTVAEQAIATVSLGGDITAAITQTLVKVNSNLALNGLEAMTTVAVGASETSSTSASRSGYPSLGMDGGQTANPANTSGVVRSGER
jgi:hypothetical protein